MPLIDEEPIVTVQIESEICAYEVAVNDVPILKGPEGYPISVEIPVNHWLQSGVNSLSLKVGPSPDYPDGDEDAKCEVTMYAKRRGAPRERRKKVTELKWSAKDGPDMGGGGPSLGDVDKKLEKGEGDDEEEQKGLEIVDVKPVKIDAKAPIATGEEGGDEAGEGGGGEFGGGEASAGADEGGAEGEAPIEGAPSAEDLEAKAEGLTPKVEMPDGAEGLAGKLGGLGGDGPGGGSGSSEMTLSREVELLLPLPEWAWVKGEEIPADDETLASLLPMYQEAWKLLSEGDWQELVERSTTKIEELAAAFYEDFGVMERELGYEQVVDNAELEIHPWEPDDLQVEVFAEGRLARLARWDGEAPLIFVYTDESAAHYLDIMYCKTADGWLIIR